MITDLKIFRLFETVKKGGRVQKRPKKLLPTRKHNSDTFEVSPVKAKSRKGLVLYSTLSQLLPTRAGNVKTLLAMSMSMTKQGGRSCTGVRVAPA